MKKIISIILCIMLMSILCVPAVSAADESVLYSEDSTALSNITYTNPSNYMVIIPAEINANDEELTFSAYSMNILETEQLNVYCNDFVDEYSYIQLKNETETSFAQFRFSNMANINQVASFDKNDTESNFSVYPVVDNSNQIEAGEYYGTVTFSLKLETK